MAVSMQDAQNVPSLNTQEPSFEATEYPASINDDPKQPKWKVKVCPVGHMIKREVYYENQLWKECKEDWEPEEVIWPTWPGTPEAEHALASSPLDGLKDDWSKAGNRLRDSAKWMATVLGAGLAAVVGTSPLGALQEHKLHGWAIVLGAVGFVLLGFTLFLVLQVMRPRTVSYDQVQNAKKGRFGPYSPLYKWQQVVQSQHDLYLPRGVRSLGSLRDAMIIEEVTLISLARAKGTANNVDTYHMLCGAENARVAWLIELREAAAKIVAIGEYFNLHRRSTLATYLGVVCGVFGTMLLVGAFALPFS